MYCCCEKDIKIFKTVEKIRICGKIGNGSRSQFGSRIQGMLRKVIVRIEMKNGIVSNNEIRVSYSNSVSSQENLTVSKMALLSFEYDMV